MAGRDLQKTRCQQQAVTLHDFICGVRQRYIERVPQHTYRRRLQTASNALYRTHVHTERT